jgi:hypothetical protein
MECDGGGRFKERAKWVAVNQASNFHAAAFHISKWHRLL